MIPFIDLPSQQKKLEKPLKEAIDRVLTHGQYILGPEVKELEENLIAYTGAKFCTTVANGTDALQIALMALEPEENDEVIMPAFSYIATAEAAALLGLKIVYVDIDPNTFNIDPGQIENKITSRTKAIIAVSLFGLPANFNAINSVAKKYDIAVIEDAAQSFGGSSNSKKSCNLTTIACTSFFPTKPLGCYGDGGAVFTSDSDLALKIRQIARHGQSKRYHHVRVGINSRLDTIQAAILLVKLSVLDEEIAQRSAVAVKYMQGFENSEKILSPIVPSGYKSAWAQYTIRVLDRDNVQKHLDKLGIPSVVHYPLPLTKQPSVASNESVPCSELIASEVLSIPVFGNLNTENQNHIIDSVIKSAE